MLQADVLKFAQPFVTILSQYSITQDKVHFLIKITE
jgi:hypothetical protein